jgi:hypothetical protein
MAVSQLQMNLDQTGRKHEALHLLILSGVVRPSHVGLRYMTLLIQAEEETSGSRNSPLAPAQALHCLYRMISFLRGWNTQLWSREPQYLQPSPFKPYRTTTARMCLRG